MIDTAAPSPVETFLIIEGDTTSCVGPFPSARAAEVALGQSDLVRALIEQGASTIRFTPSTAALPEGTVNFFRADADPSEALRAVL